MPSPVDTRVLAIQLQEPHATQANQAGQLTFTPAWRPVLSVQYIFGKVQTTVFYGNQLIVPGGRWQGSMSTDYTFHMFLAAYFNKPSTWVQLQYVPLLNSTPLTLQQVSPLAAATQQPISSGKMTVLDAGSDSRWGMWIEFAGNFWLTSPIFQNWLQTPGLVHRDGPNYNGFLGAPKTPSVRICPCHK